MSPVTKNTLIAVSSLLSSEILVYCTQAGYNNNYKIYCCVDPFIHRVHRGIQRNIYKVIRLIYFRQIPLRFGSVSPSQNFTGLVLYPSDTYIKLILLCEPLGSHRRVAERCQFQFLRRQFFPTISRKISNNIQKFFVFLYFLDFYLFLGFSTVPTARLPI